MTQTVTPPDTEKRVKDLRDALQSEADKLSDIRAKSPEEREPLEAEARDCVRSIERLDAELSAILATQRPVSRGPVAATANTGEGETRQRHLTLGDRIVDTDEYRDWLARGRRGPFVYEGKGNLADTSAIRSGPTLEQRALLDEANTGATAAFQLLPLGTPFLNPNAIDRVRLFVQDLVGSGQTSLASVPYIRELNPRTTETGVSSVAEGAAKPELTATFQRDDAPVRKVAGFFPITEEILADAPTVRAYIDERLRYMVALREELEILKGNGVAPDLKGIFSFTGGGQVQTQATVGAGKKADTIGMAASLIQNVDGSPDGVAMNPADFWSMQTYRSAGSGQFDVLTAWQQGQPYQVWGLPVVTTRNVTAGTCYVGAWRMGAQLLRREEYTVRVADQHQDYFIKNLLIILGESRLALAVHRPDWFVSATLT